jgi:hypothetical protein
VLSPETVQGVLLCVAVESILLEQCLH